MNIKLCVSVLGTEVDSFIKIKNETLISSSHPIIFIISVRHTKTTKRPNKNAINDHNKQNHWSFVNLMPLCALRSRGIKANIRLRHNWTVQFNAIHTRKVIIYNIT